MLMNDLKMPRSKHPPLTNTVFLSDSTSLFLFYTGSFICLSADGCDRQLLAVNAVLIYTEANTCLPMHSDMFETC